MDINDIDDPINLLHGEELLFNDALNNISLQINNEDIIARDGLLWLTNYKIIIKFNAIGIIEIPYYSISSFINNIIKNTGSFTIYCRDLSIFIISLTIPNQSKNFINKLTKLSKLCSKSIDIHELPCFKIGILKNNYNGWNIFDITDEFTRQGIDMNKWRISFINSKYELYTSYPSKLVVPLSADDTLLYSISKIRKNNIIQSLTWGSKTGGLLLRSSHLIYSNDNLYNQYMRSNETFIKYIMNIVDKYKIIIVDLCSMSDFPSNLYKDFYSDFANITLLGISHDNDIIEMFNSLQNALELKNKQNIYDNAFISNWIQLTHKILNRSNSISNMLKNNEIVLLQSDSGIKTLSIISGIVQLIRDPFYRTIKGLCILIEKEFIYYGHNFKYSLNSDGTIFFILFCDIISQIMIQNPYSFEYDDTFLLFIISEIYSCKYGTFCHFGEIEKHEYYEKTSSLWSYIFDNEENFINPLFIDEEELIIHDRINSTVFWARFFLKHSCRTGTVKAEVLLEVIENPNITSIELTNLQLLYLPLNFKYSNHLYSLEKICISGNLLTSIPLQLSGAKNLKILDLSNNHIKYLTTDYIEILSKQLIILDLSYNRLIEISSYLSRLTQLKKLLLQHNQLQTIPNISNLQIIELNISNNIMQEIPKYIFSIISLEIFHFSSNLFNEIPNNIYKLQNLQDIKLRGYPQNYLPNNFNTLVNITSLDISHTLINIVPYEILSFLHLKYLSMSGLSLKELPEDFKNFCDLEYLDISNNDFSYFPNVLLNLSELSYLNLRNNNISYIPIDISRLINLQELYLDYNNLSELTSGIGILDKLYVLNISYNNIIHLPATIGFMITLQESKRFIFSDNPNLQTPSQDIISQGYDNIFKYLRSLLEGSQNIYRMKTMVLGQENVGKTKLVHHLKDYINNGRKLIIKSDKYNPALYIPNDGVDINTIDNVEFKIQSKHSKIQIDMSIWDFAGQDIYYTTHQYFLTDNSLYILVWNIAKNKGISRIQYWLNLLQYFAPNSPVILVGTHIDDPICTKTFLDNIIVSYERTLCNQYPNIKGIYVINNITNEGLQNLDLAIQSIILNQSYMGEQIPISYLALEKILKDEKEKREYPIITKQEFFNFAKSCNIIDNNSHNNVLEWLHKVGKIIYFKDNPILTDIIILDIVWLNNLFNSIFTRNEYITNGILQNCDLYQIWNSEKFPPNLHRKLYNILTEFELIYCYPLSLNTPNSFDIFNRKSLIPALLPEKRPFIEKYWSYYPGPQENQYGRRFKLSYIPLLFISRLFVRILHCIEPTILWRYGMILEYNNDISCNVVFPEFIEGHFIIFIDIKVSQNIIDITVRGNAKKLAKYIFDTIDNVKQTFSNIKMETLIPCIHCIRERTYSPYMFSLESCKQAINEKKTSIKCNNNIDVELSLLIPCIYLKPKLLTIDYKSITLLSEIGIGDYYNIYVGRINDKEVAIKTFNSPDFNIEYILEKFNNEINILSILSHPNIIKVHGITIEPCYIIYEYMPYGNLYNLIHDNDINLSWNFRWRCAMDIAKGMTYLHNVPSPPIIHKHLSLSNMLINSLIETAEIVVKITDMESIKVNENVKITRVNYAPEILSSLYLDSISKLSKEANVYSYGIMLYEIASQTDFFVDIKDISILKKKVIQGKRPKIPKNIPDEFKTLIEDCWHQNPKYRPTFIDIVNRLTICISKYCPSYYKNIKIESNKIIENNGVLSSRKHRSEKEIEIEKQEIEFGIKETYTKEMGTISKLLEIHDSAVTCLLYIQSLNNTSPHVWSGTENGTIYIWALEGILLNTIDIITTPIITMILVNEFVWVLSADCTIKILYAKNGKLKKVIQTPPLLCLERVNNNIWAGSANSYIYIYSCKTGKQKKKFAAIKNSPVYCIRFIKSVNMIWIGTDPESGCIGVFTEKYKPVLNMTFNGHSENINCIIENKGNIWSCSSDRTIMIWIKDDDKILLQGHSQSVNTLLSSDLYVWSLSSDKNIIIWDTEFNKKYKQFEAHKDAITSGIFIPDNGNIWTASSDKTIRLWYKHP